MSRVLDAHERDLAKARKVVGVGEPIKDISAVRRLERDAHARFGHDGVKVAYSRTLHRTGAWLSKSSSAPEEDLPNCVPQEGRPAV